MPDTTTPRFTMIKREIGKMTGSVTAPVGRCVRADGVAGVVK